MLSAPTTAAAIAAAAAHALIRDRAFIAGSLQKSIHVVFFVSFVV
jgi:hypothetical protein